MNLPRSGNEGQVTAASTAGEGAEAILAARENSVGQWCITLSARLRE